MMTSTMPMSVDFVKAAQNVEKTNLSEPYLQKLQNLENEMVLWMSPMRRRLRTLMQRRLKTVSRRSLSAPSTLRQLGLALLKQLDRGLVGVLLACHMSLLLNINLNSMKNHVQS